MAAKKEWAKLPKRICEGCPTKYKPYRPDQRFCSAKCRLDYHHHGGAYVKLKALVEKLIDKKIGELRKSQRAAIAEEVAAQLKTIELASHI